MNTIKCLICNENSLFLFKKNYVNASNNNTHFDCNFYKCEKCRTVFIYPQPDEVTLASSYSPEYECYKKKFEMNSKLFPFIKNKLALWRYPKKLNILALLLCSLSFIIEIVSGKKITYTLSVPLNINKDAEILEIGFGTGYWLLMMKSMNYNNLNGFDISENLFYNETLKYNDINVKNDSNLLRVLWSKKFDLIRLEHVFEHISNPHEICKYIFAILSETGILVMTLPTIDSIVKQRKWLESSYDLDVPHHLIHYSKKSIKLLLKSHGFKNISVANIPVFENFLRNIIIRLGLSENILNNIFIKLFRVSFAPVYFSMCAFLNKGEFLSVKAEK
jgi:2-polyprenyl-3-methyl-5-hydroxy-6-metoxy-1,4-benzoquinol methylase